VGGSSPYRRRLARRVGPKQIVKGIDDQNKQAGADFLFVCFRIRLRPVPGKAAPPPPPRPRPKVVMDTSEASRPARLVAPPLWCSCHWQAALHRLGQSTIVSQRHGNAGAGAPERPLMAAHQRRQSSDVFIKQDCSRPSRRQPCGQWPASICCLAGRHRSFTSKY
jgi:hypothetical protein